MTISISDGCNLRPFRIMCIEFKFSNYNAHNVKVSKTELIFHSSVYHYQFHSAIFSSILEDTLHIIIYTVIMDDGHKSRLNYKTSDTTKEGTKWSYLDNIKHSKKTTQCDRLETFLTWTLSYPDPFILSKLGFIFTGNADRVQCCECYKMIDNWCNKSNPLLEHYKVNNSCTFVQSFKEVLLTFTINVDIMSKGRVEDRINTYANKEMNLPRFLSVVSLAHAGFNYLGPGDRVKCHSCGIILVDWESIDIPIAEHYRWSSNCKYVQQCLPKLDKDVDSKLKVELGEQYRSLSPESETGNYNSITRESYNFPVSSSCIENTSHNLGLGPSQMVRESTSSPTRPSFQAESLKYPTQEQGSDDTNRESAISEGAHGEDESGTNEDELTTMEHIKDSHSSNVAEGLGNDEDELSKILASEKVEAAKEIFGFPSYVIEEFIRRYYKQHHRDFESAAHLCSALLEEQEQNQNGKETCDSKPSTKAEPSPETPNELNNLNFSKTVTNTESRANIPTNKTVEKARKEERFVSSFDSKLSLNSEGYVPCKICLDNEVQVTFIPCRHLVTCEECSKLVTVCPICREHIQDRMKIYLS